MGGLIGWLVSSFNFYMVIRCEQIKKAGFFCLIAFFGLPFLSCMFYHWLKEQWDVSVMGSHEGRIPGG